MCPFCGDMSVVSGDMGGCSGDMTGCQCDDMAPMAGDFSDYQGDMASAGPNDIGDFKDTPDVGSVMESQPYQDAQEANFDTGAGTAEGAIEMSAEAAGMGAMEMSFSADGSSQSFETVDQGDAALGQAMDSAMDQGGAPAAGGEQPMDSGMAEAIVDPAMDDGPKDDDQGGGLAG